jgi:hypothetical protein
MPFLYKKEMMSKLKIFGIYDSRKALSDLGYLWIHADDGFKDGYYHLARIEKQSVQQRVCLGSNFSNPMETSRSDPSTFKLDPNINLRAMEQILNPKQTQCE